MAKVWKKNEFNSILEGEGFFISYNPCPGMGTTFFMGDNNSDETALVNPSDSKKYRILNGDFREEYEAVIDQGWEACLAIYEKHKEEYDSSWSSGD